MSTRSIPYEWDDSSYRHISHGVRHTANKEENFLSEAEQAKEKTFQPWPTSFGWLLRMQICTAVLGIVGLTVADYQLQCNDQKLDRHVHLVTILSIVCLSFLASWRRETAAERIVKPKSNQEDPPFISFNARPESIPMPEDVATDNDDISSLCYRQQESDIKKCKIVWVPYVIAEHRRIYAMVTVIALGTIAAPIFQLVANGKGQCNFDPVSPIGGKSLSALTLVVCAATGGLKGFHAYQVNQKQLHVRLMLRHLIIWGLADMKVSATFRKLQKQTLTSIWNQCRPNLNVDARTLEMCLEQVNLINSICSDSSAASKRASNLVSQV